MHWRDVCEERKIEKAKGKRKSVAALGSIKDEGDISSCFLLSFHRCVSTREREPPCGGNLFFILRIILHT